MGKLPAILHSLQIMKTLSVIIPCYNAEKTVGRLIKSFGSGLPWVKLIFVDDCSKDGTIGTIDNKDFGTQMNSFLVLTLEFIRGAWVADIAKSLAL